jgi:hypothetical protein
MDKLKIYSFFYCIIMSYSVPIVFGLFLILYFFNASYIWYITQETQQPHRMYDTFTELFSADSYQPQQMQQPQQRQPPPPLTPMQQQMQTLTIVYSKMSNICLANMCFFLWAILGSIGYGMATAKKK